jgi:hypothetical protein
MKPRVNRPGAFVRVVMQKKGLGFLVWQGEKACRLGSPEAVGAQSPQDGGGDKCSDAS